MVGNINNVNDLFIGTRNPLGEYFNGNLDEVQLWNKALNQSEIEQFINCPPIGNESGLVGYWNFEEGSGNTVLDLTVNGNDGTINGAAYSANVPEQYCHLTTVNGCDSVAVLNLTINQPDTSFNEVSSCESYVWNGEVYTESGTYEYSEQNNNEYSLSFDGVDDYVSFSGMAGVYPSFSFVTTIKLNSDNYNQSLFYIGQELTGNNTTGSIDLTIDDINYSPAQLQINLNYNHGIAVTQSFNIGDWMDIAGVFDGNNQMLYMYINGQLVSSTSTTVNNISLSQNDLHKIGAGFINSSQSTGNFFNGSLSSLSFFNKVLSQDEIDAYKTCPPNGSESGLLTHWNFEEGQGETVIDLSGNGNDGTINGAMYSSDVPEQSCQLSTVNGCDSVAVLNLTINNSNNGVDTQVHCDTYTWIDGNTYTTSNNTATFTLTNAAGCDSIVTLDLIINNSNTGVDVQEHCDTYTWIDGNTYTTSNNTATFTLTNAAGCDSIVTLDLIINNSNTGVDVQEHCDTYTWIDGNTYTTSNNTATFTLTNAAGCDSVVTLNLTINNSNNGLDVQQHCDVYTWIDGNTYTTSNNTATFTLTNAAGCDSVVTLNLTINNSNNGLDVQEHCDAYTWIDGNTYTTSNNTATFTLTNAAGCDSVVTLDLTINNSNNGLDVQEHCDTYTWIDGVTYNSSNNIATHTLTNAVGCDSVVTLNLTINQSTSSYDSVIVCDSYDWNGTTYFESGNYVYTSTNVNGCDSLANLHLIISQLELLSINGDQVAFTETENNTYSISNSNASSTYFWSLSNNLGTIDGGNANNSEIIITWGENDSETILCVYEEDEFGCQGEESCLNIDVKRLSSINDFEEEILLVYPNPFTHKTTVSFDNPTQSKAVIKVIDSRGRVVREYSNIISNKIIIKKKRTFTRIV